MIDPENTRQIMDDHFGQIDTSEFTKRRDEYVEPDVVPAPLGLDADATEGQVILFQPESAPLTLRAYLATALTGLTEEQRVRLMQVSTLVVSICKEFEIEVYEPHSATDPLKHPHVPPEEVFRTDRAQVLASDLVVHIADYPSTGAGEELDFALGALIPIVLISHGDTRVSRMVTGIPGLKLEIRYADLDELGLELRERLTEIRPILEERKLSFSDFDRNLVGNKVRLLREGLELTRDDVAAHSSGLVTQARLRDIEENGDKISNPSLLELRALSAILKTTVADLVEPDLNERVLVLLREWVEGRSAARQGMTERDMRSLIRRIVYRALEGLEEPWPSRD